MSQFTDRHKSYEKLAKQGRLKEFRKPKLVKENLKKENESQYLNQLLKYKQEKDRKRENAKKIRL